MEKDWIKIKTYSNAIEAEIVKQMLEENNVPAIVMNKQDSSCLFGKLELYVHENLKETALNLIVEGETNQEGETDVN